MLPHFSLALKDNRISSDRKEWKGISQREEHVQRHQTVLCLRGKVGEDTVQYSGELRLENPGGKRACIS